MPGGSHLHLTDMVRTRRPPIGTRTWGPVTVARIWGPVIAARIWGPVTVARTWGPSHLNLTDVVRSLESVPVRSRLLSALEDGVDGTRREVVDEGTVWSVKSVHLGLCHR